MSETWGQKYDLTIPSLEMPSTSGLDSKAKHEIMLGWTCCYRNELINAVRLEHSLKSIEYSLKANQKKFGFTPQYWINRPVEPYLWYTFWALQISDVWSTQRGMDYDCVFEANPLLPEVPHRDRLILHKLIFLTPFDTLYDERVLTNGEMIFPLLLSGYVVENNFRVIDRAKQRCQKR